MRGRRRTERQGFEPQKACALTVFKTAAFDRSATSPKICEANFRISSPLGREIFDLLHQNYLFSPGIFLDLTFPLPGHGITFNRFIVFQQNRPAKFCIPASYPLVMQCNALTYILGNANIQILSSAFNNIYIPLRFHTMLRVLVASSLASALPAPRTHFRFAKMTALPPLRTMILNPENGEVVPISTIKFLDRSGHLSHAFNIFLKS